MADEATPVSNVKETRTPESRLPDRAERIAHSRAGPSNMVRRQFVRGLAGKATPRPFFSELFISIRDLREALMPGVDIPAGRSGSEFTGQ